MAIPFNARAQNGMIKAYLASTLIRMGEYVVKLFEAIKERRSVYFYKPDPVPEETLMQVLEAGTLAPSHGNIQPWEFVLIGPEGRGKLLGMFREFVEAGPLQDPNLPEARKEVLRKFRKDFGGAPVLLAVLTKPPVNPVDKPEYPVTGGLAAQNIMLAATSLGLGTVWLSVGQNPKARDVLQAPEGGTVIAVLPLGYPEVVPPAKPREPAADKIRRVP